MHAQRDHPFRQFAGVVLAKKEIVVVELHRVRTVVATELSEDSRRTGRRFHLFARTGKGHDSAEIALVRAADTRLVHRGSRAQESGPQILFGIKPVIWHRREVSGRAQRALRVVHVQSELVLERQAADAGVLPPAFERGEKLDKCILALAAHDKIDIACVQGGVRIEGREIAAPHHGHLRVRVLEPAADRKRGDHLRHGHHRDGKQAGGPLAHDAIDGCARIIIDIAVDDRVFFLTLDHRREREDRKRVAPVLRLCGAWIEEQDHRSISLPSRIQNREGGLARLSRAFQGRRCQRRPYQGLWTRHMRPISRARAAIVARSRYSMLEM